MENYEKWRFSTSEFAKLCGVRKDTLFHYDRIGIFRPASRGENGYRYYTYQQLEIFNVIWTLRELGMPLSEIKEYLSGRTPERFVALLERQSEHVDDKVRRLSAIKDFIRKKTAVTEAALRARPDEVFVETLPARPALVVPVLPTKKNAGLPEAFLAFYELCEKHLFTPHFIGGVVPRECVGRGSYLSYSHLYCTCPKNADTQLLPAGEYAAAYSEGYAAIGEAYSRLLRFIEDLGARPTGGFLEDTLLDELSVNGPENYLLKLSVKIERKPR